MPHKLVSWEGGGGARCCKRVSRCSSTVNIIIIGARAGTAARNDWLFYLVWYSMVWYGVVWLPNSRLDFHALPSDADGCLWFHFSSFHFVVEGAARSRDCDCDCDCDASLWRWHWPTTYSYIHMYVLSGVSHATHSALLPTSNGINGPEMRTTLPLRYILLLLPSPTMLLKVPAILLHRKFIGFV